jgi:5-methylcytosine-specific restriction protein A
MDRLPFIPGQIYKRSLLHDEYGGNRQGGITPSRNYPYIFIFSGKKGGLYGYEDEWISSSIFSYTGEGQEGDMKFVRGNLALRDHLQNEKRVFLFENRRSGYVEFVSELEIYDFGFFETPDRNRSNRAGIKFFFKKAGTIIPVKPEDINNHYVNEVDVSYKKEGIILETERISNIKSRIGQSVFRQGVCHRWEYQCAVTKFDKLDILIASHIVPWAEATNEERLDIHNGILLSPTYDALFDRHLITFDQKGSIVLSNKIDFSAYQKIGVSGKEKIQNLSTSNLSYLERHSFSFMNLK